MKWNQNSVGGEKESRGWNGLAHSTVEEDSYDGKASNSYWDSGEWEDGWCKEHEAERDEWCQKIANGRSQVYITTSLKQLQCILCRKDESHH